MTSRLPTNQTAAGPRLRLRPAALTAAAQLFGGQRGGRM